MDDELLKEALDIVKKASGDEKLIDEATNITSGMYQEYISELKELWRQSEYELFYNLSQLKSIKDKLKSLGENPKAFEDNHEFDEKLDAFLDQLAPSLPKSADVQALEEIYEKGEDPYMYGKNH